MSYCQKVAHNYKKTNFTMKKWFTYNLFNFLTPGYIGGRPRMHFGDPGIPGAALQGLWESFSSMFKGKMSSLIASYNYVIITV